MFESFLYCFIPVSNSFKSGTGLRPTKIVVYSRRISFRGKFISSICVVVHVTSKLGTFSIGNFYCSIEVRQERYSNYPIQRFGSIIINHKQSSRIILRYENDGINVDEKKFVDFYFVRDER